MTQEVQAITLLEFTKGEDGPTWVSQRKGWNIEEFVCEWEGIGCNSLGFITSINLEGTSLFATIPVSIVNFSSLQHLLLGSNLLYGSIPSDLGKLTNLVYLDLSRNRLRGSLPEFSSLNNNLKMVILSHNQFSGKISPNYGLYFKSVRVLDIKDNKVSGIIPTTLGHMENLMELDLSNNYLVGYIPKELGNILKLEGLFLNDNKLIGRIPLTLTREFLLLKQLHLHRNNLSGTIPLALSELPKLEILFIEGNKLTGTIPRELCDRNLNENFFSHTLTEEFLNITSLKRDGCNSIACSAGWQSTNDEGKDGVFPCEKCSSKDGNPYIGSNKCKDVKIEEILFNFYLSTDGVNWKRNGDSWKDKNVPVCEKQGIECSFDSNIIAIRLKDMQLSGTIPGDLGFLRSLEILDLSDNSLFGGIPNELKFLPLVLFDVSGNMLTGFVPPDLCEKDDVNENGYQGQFSCSHLACPVGTYSSFGRQTQQHLCQPCSQSQEALFLASKTCSPISGSSPEIMNPNYYQRHHISSVAQITGLACVVGVTIVSLIILVVRYKDTSTNVRSEYTKGVAVAEEPTEEEGILDSYAAYKKSQNDDTVHVQENQKKENEEKRSLWTDVPDILKV